MSRKNSSYRKQLRQERAILRGGTPPQPKRIKFIDNRSEEEIEREAEWHGMMMDYHGEEN